MSTTDVQTNIRVPEGLKRRLIEAARQNQRAMGAEMVARLEASFEASPEVDRLRTQIEHLTERLEDCQSLAKMETGMSALVAMSLRTVIESLPDEFRSDPGIKIAEELATTAIHRNIADLESYVAPEGAAEVAESMMKLRNAIVAAPPRPPRAKSGGLKQAPAPDERARHAPGKANAAQDQKPRRRMRIRRDEKTGE